MDKLKKFSFPYDGKVYELDLTVMNWDTLMKVGVGLRSVIPGGEVNVIKVGDDFSLQLGDIKLPLTLNSFDRPVVVMGEGELEVSKPLAFLSEIQEETTRREEEIARIEQLVTNIVKGLIISKVKPEDGVVVNGNKWFSLRTAEEYSRINGSWVTY